MASSAAILGFVNQEASVRDFKPPDEAMLSWLPNLRSLSQQSLDLAESFELVVRALIEGIHEVLSQSTHRPRQRRGTPAGTRRKA